MLRPPRRPQSTQVGPQGRGLLVERVNRLERPQGRVELSRMAVERIERSLDALRLVALLGDREILHARKRLARRRLRGGPGFGLH